MHASRNQLLKMVHRESFPAAYEALRNDRPLPTSSKVVRLQPFCEHNLICLGGRLQFADLSHTEKHPILLDGSQHVTHLPIRHTHIDFHHLGVRVVPSHLRHEFWILRARQNIKKILRTCLPCKTASNAREQKVEAPLPAERVLPSTPFAVTGLDFAGPLYTKRNRSANSYLLLVLRQEHLILNFPQICPWTNFSWHWTDLLTVEDSPTLFNPISPLHYKQPAENWPRYVPS